jgi:hypothetical protein
LKKAKSRTLTASSSRNPPAAEISAPTVVEIAEAVADVPVVAAVAADAIVVVATVAAAGVVGTAAVAEVVTDWLRFC